MGNTGSGANGPGQGPGEGIAELDAVLHVNVVPLPWAVRRTAAAATFRCRLGTGWAKLPAQPFEADQGITFGLASAPIILRSLGGSHPIPANTVWAVPSDGAWRIVAPRVTDLRLVHTEGRVMGAPATMHRPVRFQGTVESSLRAAIRGFTPVWLDERCRPVINLASLGGAESATLSALVRSASPAADHDMIAAFVMLATCAFDQLPQSTDQRLGRVIDFIDANLADPALSTDTVAAGCAVSRRTLQAMLADQGGVAHYLRRQRLAAVLRFLLEDPGHFPDLDEVARATGLGSRRTLERAMRQVYGLTPRQARVQAFAGFPIRELRVREQPGTDELRAG